MFKMIAVLIVGICHLMLARKRFQQYLRFFQQEEYHHQRFIHWWWRKFAVDRRASLIALTAIGVTLYISYPAWASILYGGALAVLAHWEPDAKSTGKVVLKMTVRAKAIELAGLSLYGMVLFLGLLVLPWYQGWGLQILLLQAMPFFVVAGNMMTWFWEGKKQEEYLRQAKQIIKEVDPYIIGITGSQGKTSTKLLLTDVLRATLGATFCPQGSINTPMGITAKVRSKLLQGTNYAVIEMGAYQRGSITRLCQLAPPKAAIITGVGLCHLERFGSQREIFIAKSELAKSVPQDGILVCNGDNSGARRIAREYPKKTVLFYGFDDSQELDAHISDWSLDERGTSFVLRWKGREYHGKSTLFGKAALSNLMATFTMACALGGDPYYVLAALEVAETANNRLQVQKDDRITYIHDAYNSNPAGFEAALEVLENLPGQRKILMTPGMIELGEMQYQENHRLAKAAARLCDYAIVVGNVNKKALCEGLYEGGMESDKIILAGNRDKAFQVWRDIQALDDVILLENDLIDLYEAKIRF
ncbi:MAG: Mur ligase family protein [Chlamydiota bacterium]